MAKMKVGKFWKALIDSIKAKKKYSPMPVVLPKIKGCHSMKLDTFKASSSFPINTSKTQT